jgi:tetratricopeptide (TPR) repeat protein
MAFSKFIQWAEQHSEQKSLFQVILISCCFALISIVNMHGGVLNHEMELRLPFYLSDAPLLNKLFDSEILDANNYRARELSYFFDFIDSKFIEFSIENGFPHFLSLTHYLFSIATGCLLWLFCVKELNLKPLIGIGWLTLFWTSPSIFLGGSIFRAGKVGVAFLAAILFYVIYKIAAVAKGGIDFQISKKVWFLYFIAIFTITFFDEQGLFFAIIALLFLTIWGRIVRNKNIYIMLIIGMASILLHLLYRYAIAPQLTFMLNGYWPDFNYQILPIQFFIQNLLIYLAKGLYLYVETFRFLTGNLPPVVALGLLLLFITFPIFYLYTSPELSDNHKKFFILALAGLFITNFLMVITMNALMVLRNPDIISIHGITLTYYCLPATIVFAMTLAILTDIFYKSRIPKWLVLTVMCFAIIGNIVALPKNKAIILQQTHQPSSALLFALKNLGSLSDFDESLIKENLVFQFFKSKKKNNDTEYSANVYKVKGVFHAARGQHKLAIKYFDKAISRKQNYAEAYYNRGLTYFKLGQYQRAIENYNEAISIKPDHADAYNGRAIIYNKLGQHQRAVDDLNEAIHLKPDYADAYNNRGYVYLMQGNNESGCRDVQKACALSYCELLEAAKKDGVCR